MPDRNSFFFKAFQELRPPIKPTENYLVNRAHRLVGYYQQNHVDCLCAPQEDREDVLSKILIKGAALGLFEETKVDDMFHYTLKTPQPEVN